MTFCYELNVNIDNIWAKEVPDDAISQGSLTSWKGVLEIKALHDCVLHITTNSAYQPHALIGVSVDRISATKLDISYFFVCWSV